jgi:hypothetical protein
MIISLSVLVFSMLVLTSYSHWIEHRNAKGHSFKGKAAAHLNSAVNQTHEFHTPIKQFVN